jgi:hypothetical protein
MSTLICGSIAFDNIMVFHDRFKNHILPEQIHILNVAFLVPEMRREFGGCAGNIAYNLKLLDGDPLIMATVGDDADPYLLRLDAHGLSRSHVRRIAGSFTAQAFITTDLDDNQITAFHPGAMSYSHLNQVSDVAGATLAIVAPDGRDGMLKHAPSRSPAVAARITRSAANWWRTNTIRHLARTSGNAPCSVPFGAQVGAVQDVAATQTPVPVAGVLLFILAVMGQDIPFLVAHRLRLTRKQRQANRAGAAGAKPTAPVQRQIFDACQFQQCSRAIRLIVDPDCGGCAKFEFNVRHV